MSEIEPLELGITYTSVGQAALIKAEENGYKGKLTHIAIGDGGGSGYTPSGLETALRGERERIPITSSIQTGDKEFQIGGVTAPGGPQYWIREYGLILDDGTLLALWAHPSDVISGRGPGAEIEFYTKLVLDALPGDSIEIIVTPGGHRVLAALAASALATVTAQHQALKNFFALQDAKKRLAIVDTRIAELDAARALNERIAYDRALEREAQIALALRTAASIAALQTATLKNTLALQAAA